MMRLSLLKLLCVTAALGNAGLAVAGDGAGEVGKPAPSATARIELQRIGLGGKFKVGYWTPVWLAVTAGNEPISGHVELSTPDGEGVPVVFVADDAPAIEIDAHRTQVVLRYVKFGQLGGALTARLRSAADEEHVLFSASFSAGTLPTPLASTDELIVGLGPDIGLAEAIKKRLRGQSRHIVSCQLDAAELLPDEWFGYEGVNTFVIATSHTQLLEQLTDRQFLAFERWLKSGGRVLLCVGSRGREFLAPASRWMRFAPGPEANTIALRQTSGLESFAGATERLEDAGGERLRRFSIPITVFAHVRGLVENSEIVGTAGRLPTVMRYPYGFGHVVFVALDLDQPPFPQWQGRPGLVAKLLQDDAQTRRDEGSGAGGLPQVTHIGYDDLAGQLRAALDQFRGVTLVAFSWVAGLLVLYLLLIGPADYLLLKKLKRENWTWLTFTLMVVVFCALAAVLANRWRGTRLHVNQVDIVDVDLEQSVARGCNWTHVYSPTTQAFQLDWATNWPVEPAAVRRDGHLWSWQGLPGKGLGGLDSTGTAALFSQAYAISYSDGKAGIQGLPIQVSGSKSLFGRAWAELTLEQPQRLTTDSNGLLSGALTNPLAVGLADSLVLYENWAYSISGTWAPGEKLSFEGQSPRNLQWRLTRRKVVETKDVSTPWDKTSFDVPRLLEVMMFHQAAGGESYTVLMNRYQAYLDLSEHLRTGRAVVLGRGLAPASDVRRDGESLAPQTDEQFTYYRLVVPVDKP